MMKTVLTTRFCTLFNGRTVFCGTAAVFREDWVKNEFNKEVDEIHRRFDSFQRPEIFQAAISVVNAYEELAHIKEFIASLEPQQSNVANALAENLASRSDSKTNNDENSANFHVTSEKYRFFDKVTPPQKSEAVNIAVEKRPNPNLAAAAASAQY
jgi:hypothetical protein